MSPLPLAKLKDEVEGGLSPSPLPCFARDQIRFEGPPCPPSSRKVDGWKVRSTSWSLSPELPGQIPLVVAPLSLSLFELREIGIGSSSSALRWRILPSLRLSLSFP